MKKSQAQQLAAWVFGSASFLFLVAVFWLAPEAIDPTRQRILGVICAVLAGLFGYFLIGSIRLIAEGKFSHFGKISIQAAGGVALFVLMLLWWSSEKAPVKPLSQQRSDILEAYSNQIMDNLIRASSGKPFVHFAFVDSTGNVAKPVQDAAIYDAYLYFLSLDGSFKSNDKPPSPSSYHILQHKDGRYYWIPVEFKPQFFALALATTTLGGMPGATPHSYDVTVMGLAAPPEMYQRNTMVFSVFIDKKVPNFPGKALIDGVAIDFEGFMTASGFEPSQTDVLQLLVDFTPVNDPSKPNSNSYPHVPLRAVAPYELSSAFQNQRPKISLFIKGHRPEPMTTSQLLEKLSSRLQQAQSNPVPEPNPSPVSSPERISSPPIPILPPSASTDTSAEPTRKPEH
jgi:hypothetical protein